MTCNHMGPNGQFCTSEPHDLGLHYSLLKTSDDGFSLTRWNDAGETKPEEKGNMINVDYYDIGAVDAAIAQCIADANKHLDAGQVFEIRAKSRPTSVQTAKAWGVAWYWTAATFDMPEGFAGFGLLQEPLFDASVLCMIDVVAGGYLLLGRQVAG